MSYENPPIGPNLNTNYPQYNNGYGQPFTPGPHGRVQDNRREMPVVESPCDLKTPLAQGSLWPIEVLIYRHAATPLNAETFNLYEEVEISVTDAWVDVVSIELGKSEEGRAMYFAGEEEGAIGSDLFWRITREGSSPSRFDVMRGGWSTIQNMQQIITALPSEKKVALQVFLPSAGPSPRTVRGRILGWTAPYTGGGTFAGGFAKS